MTGSKQNMLRSQSRQSRLKIGVSRWARTLSSLLDSYHPELHYMRGPGPKWHAKHDRPAASEPNGIRGLGQLHV